jgi:hypothetical protein
MNSLELMLVDLVRNGAAPLYSAYCWLGRRVGRRIVLREYLETIDRLMTRDILRLWEVDYRSHDRTELFGVPSGLEIRYLATEDLHESFDPFGLTLTLGPGGNTESEPAWTVDYDFSRGHFELVAEPAALERAIRDAARYVSGVTLVPDRQEMEGSRIRVWGHIVIK